jgi:hypothetical protein
MPKTPTYPLYLPIRSRTDAEIALASMGRWKPEHDADRDLTADRMLEVLAYRVSHAWEGIVEMSPNFPEVNFRYFAWRDSRCLLKSCHFLDGVETNSRWDFSEMSDKALLGGVTNANLVRRALRRRFGRSVSRWPLLSPSNGYKAVLDAVITPEHIARRTAAILDAATSTRIGDTRARRL